MMDDLLLAVDVLLGECKGTLQVDQHDGHRRIANTIDKLRARIQQRLDAGGWMPIETAPKDGTMFLGYKNGEVRECYKVQRSDGAEMWCFGGTSGGHEFFPNIRPTHWQPLPDLPKEGDK